MKSAHASALSDLDSPATEDASAPKGAGSEFGSQLRTLRKARKLSLQVVAERAGLSISLISQIERGLTSPSLRSMRLLAAAVEVPIERLFSQPQTSDMPEGDFIVRPSSRRVLSLDHRGMLLEMISPISDGSMQTFIANISPGGGSGPEMDTHQGEEVGLILAGEFELWLDDQRYLLREGDSFRYPASIPHRYINPGQTMTRVHFAITPPFYSYSLWASDGA